jgi:hypothetical protein
MSVMYDSQVQNAKDSILRVIRSWEDYQLFTAQICDAFELAARELIAEKEKRRKTELADRPPSTEIWDDFSF